MLKILLVSVFLLPSCATSSDWGNWKEKSHRLEDRVWRFCDKRFDGNDFHEKGVCYISKECRTRTTILNNVKEECRSLRLFCKWGDIQCFKDFKILDKKIQ